MIEEDLKFQRHTWKTQRVGWLLMCSILVAALTGVFGFGGISNAVAGERESALWLEYQRYTRRMAPTELTAHCRPGPDGKFELALSADYLEAVEIQRITPEPDTAEISNTETRFTFRGQPGAELTVNFEIQPRRAGRMRGVVGNGPTSIRFQQLVYP